MLGGTTPRMAERNRNREQKKGGTTPRGAEHWRNREKLLLFSTTDTLARKRQTCLKELIGALQMLIGLGLIDVVHSQS